MVCSDIAVHKEIGGDGIAAVEASYIDQACDNLYNILFNKGMRESLIPRGLKNADRFDWRKTAQNTIDLYRKIDNEQKRAFVDRLSGAIKGKGVTREDYKKYMEEKYLNA